MNQDKFMQITVITKMSLIILLFVLLLCLFHACSFSRKFVYYPQSVSEARIKYLETTYRNVYEVEIPINHEMTLHGWIIQKDLTNLPTLIYFGGNAEEASFNIEGFEQNLDANVVLINYRGYGLSAGKPKEKALKSDAECIHDFILDRFQIDPARIVVCGRSLGTGIASYLASTRRTDKLILISPYDSIERVAGHSFPDWFVTVFLCDKYKTIDFCSRVQSKVLIIASANDKVIPFENTQNLIDHLTCEKEIVYINQANHNNLSEFETYWTAIRDFIQ